MYPNDNADDLWRFLAQLDESRFEQKCREVRLRFSGLTEGDDEFRNFIRYMRNRFFANIGRMRSGGRSRRSRDSPAQIQAAIERRQELFSDQLEILGRTPAASSIRFFLPTCRFQKMIAFSADHFG